MKRRGKSNGVVALAREYEAATDALKAAQARVAELQKRLVSAVDSGPVAVEKAGRATGARNGVAGRGARRRKVKDWGKVRDRVLGSMKKGQLYTGHDLQDMARVSVSSGTFIANVRDELLASKAIQKVTEDKKPWKKGMSPRSVRWLRA